MEHWKEIFDGNYAISSMGQIKRLKAAKGTQAGRLLKPSLRKAKNSRSGGYYRVSIWVGNIKKDAYIHQLVAEAFIGPRPKDHEINHKDRNTAHNFVDNLEYIDSIKHKQMVCGDGHGRAKLCSDDVRKIKRMLEHGYQQKEIAEIFCVNKTAIQKIASGQNWSHIK